MVHDLQSRRLYDCFTTRSTWTDGPFWSQVFRQVTYGADGKKIFDEEIDDNMSFDEVHKQLEPMQRTMETHLWYMPLPVDGVKPKKGAKVDTPSKTEILEHESQNHAVYRNWCEVCVKARSAGTVHKKKETEEEKQDFMQSSPFLALKMTPSGRPSGNGSPRQD